MGTATVVVTEPEGAEPPVQGAEEEGSDALSLDDLIGLSDEDLEIDEDDVVEDLKTGGKPSADVIKGLPADAQKLVLQLRGDYTRKTQALALERRQLAAERAAHQREVDAALLAPPKADAKAAKRIDPATADLLDPKVMAAFIEQQVNDRLAAASQPQREAAIKRQAQVAYETFLAEHEDFPEYEDDVAAALEANEHLDLEDAYWMVRGRSSAKKAVESRDARRKEALRIGGSRGSGREVPDDIANDPVATMRWLEGRRS